VAGRGGQDNARYRIRGKKGDAMRVEILGQYRLELSAMQLIDNGGWTAYAAVRGAEGEGPTQLNPLPYQRVVDDMVFESEASALAAARRVAIAVVGAVKDHS
jgi:hypothetical protein